MKKDGSLTEEEWTAIKDTIQLKAEKIGRPYLINVERIVFLRMLNGYEYMIKIFNSIARRWETYSVCPFGNVRMGTYQPPKNPIIGAGY